MIRLRYAWRGFRSAQDGSTVIEFAVIAPVLIIMIFGLVEVTNMLSFNRKVALAAQTMVDMLARMEDPELADTGEVGEAVRLVLRPFQPTFDATIAVVDFDDKGVAILTGASAPAQIYIQGTRELKSDEILSETAGLSIGNDRTIIGRLNASYEPVLDVPFLSGVMTMTSVNMQRPRPSF